VSLETAVAVPFRQRGVDRLAEGELVVAFSLDRDWFSPDQAERLIDAARGRGLLEEVEGGLAPTFDPAAVDVPARFRPDESILRAQSTFERLLDAVTDAGIEKREAVAAINRRQRELAITIEAAAVLYAREHGIDVGREARRVRSELRSGGDGDDGEDGGEGEVGGGAGSEGD